VLIAGLGVGFTLAEVLAVADVEAVTVVEIEEPIVRWNAGPLAPGNGRALEDPRVTVVVADFVEWIERTSQRFDAICLDVDNGPDWTVTDDNRRLYTTRHLEALRRLLTDAGRLAIWSAAPAPEFVRRLQMVFGEVRTYESPTVTGPPDLIWVVHA
jgi:spermidine synthase